MNVPAFHEQYLRTRVHGELYLGQREDGTPHFLPRTRLNQHCHVLAPPGGGKTRFLRLLLEQMVDMRDCFVAWLDPHDGPEDDPGLHTSMKNYVYKRGHAQRLITFDPAETTAHGLVAGLNPLQTGQEPRRVAAEAADCLRMACGDSGSFAATPQLWRYMNDTTYSLAANKLTLREAERVIDPDDESYREILAEQLRDSAPDVASDWAQVLGNPRLVNERLGSLTARIRGLMVNPALRATLSTRLQAIDLQRAIANRSILGANLSPTGMGLLESKMFGTLLLHSLCVAAMTRPAWNRTPMYLVLDESYLFNCPALLSVLDGTRKFGLSVIMAHQSMSQMVDTQNQDWRYHTAAMNARLQVVLPGLGDTDAMTMNKQLYGAFCDPRRERQRFYHTSQTSHQEWHLFTTVSQAETDSWADTDTDGSAHTEASTHGSGRSNGHQWSSGTNSGTGSDDSRGESRSLQDPESGGTQSSHADHASQGSNDSSGGSSSDSESDAYSVADGDSSAHSSTHGGSTTRGVSYTYAPINVPDPPKQELSSIAWEPVDDQLYDTYQRIRLLAERRAVTWYRPEEPQVFTMEEVPDSDRTRLAMVRLDGERLRALPFFGRLEAFEAEARERDAAFRKRALPLLAPAAVEACAQEPEPVWVPYEPEPRT